MTIPLREYLAQRRADIQSSMKAMRVELVEIEAALAAIDGAAENRSRKERGTIGSGKKTLKEMALEVLQEHPEGLDAHAILAAIKDRFDTEVARESLSPQLSRLGQDNVVTRQGYIWKLLGAPITSLYLPQKDETPGVSPPDASASEVDPEDEIPF